MKRNVITKITALSLAAMMTVSLTACGGSNSKPQEEAASTGIANPVKEMTEEEMCEQTGIDLPLPKDASDAVYSVIESEDGDIAQVDFTLNGEKMYLRACHTKMTDMLDSQGQNEADLEEIKLDAGDISGLNYTWNQQARVIVSDRDAIVRVTKEGQGYVAWLDVVPGILYNLCMTENADSEKLISTAETVFVPMQGES